MFVHIIYSLDIADIDDPSHGMFKCHLYLLHSTTSCDKKQTIQSHIILYEFFVHIHLLLICEFSVCFDQQTSSDCLNGFVVADTSTAFFCLVDFGAVTKVSSMGPHRGGRG